VLDPERRNAGGTPVRGEQWKAIYPKACELLAGAVADPRELKPKDFYKRRRPDDSGDDGYPSGHASRASIHAAVSAQVVPGRVRELTAEALVHGMHRVVLNKHYATDIWAGSVLGQNLGLRMSGNAKFQADLAGARAEWQSARFPGNCGVRPTSRTLCA